MFSAAKFTTERLAQTGRRLRRTKGYGYYEAKRDELACYPLRCMTNRKHGNNEHMRDFPTQTALGSYQAPRLFLSIPPVP